MRSMVFVGGGAPAQQMRVVPRPGISPSHFGAASRIALATAGAAHITVTPCCCTRRRISVPSILRMMTCLAPMPVAAYSTPQPLQWNCGSVCRYTSRSVRPSCQPNVVALSQMLRCVSCTPLGRAVVPLV